MCKTPHLLTVNICLVPDQLVDQTGPSRIPPLVQPSLDRRTDVHLRQATQGRNGGQRGRRSEEDSQQREVACSAGAQVVQLHKSSWDGNFFLDCLGRARNEKYGHEKEAEYEMSSMEKEIDIKENGVPSRLLVVTMSSCNKNDFHVFREKKNCSEDLHSSKDNSCFIFFTNQVNLDLQSPLLIGYKRSYVLWKYRKFIFTFKYKNMGE